MRRMRFFTVRLRTPFEWSVLGARMGVVTGAVALSAFVAMLMLVDAGMPYAALAVSGALLAVAWSMARWLTKMAPPKPGVPLREGTILGLLRSRLESPEWSNERKWPTPIRSRYGNLVISTNGDIWANYLLAGVDFSAHDMKSIIGCQKRNSRLFGAMSRLDCVQEVHLVVSKAKVPPSAIIRRCIDHVPEWAKRESTDYKHAAEGLREFQNQYVTGRRKSFERVYWFAVRIGSAKQSWYERLLVSAGLATSRAGVDLQEARAREAEVHDAIPPDFVARRTVPAHLEWMLDRSRSRAVSVPKLPSVGEMKKIMVSGNQNFDLVTVTAGLEADALADMFMDRVVEHASESASKLRRVFRDGIFHRYRSLRRETSIAVHTPGRRTSDFPDGTTSYQSLLTVASGPSLEGSFEIHKMSGVVDGFTGLDADVSFRVDFEKLPGRKSVEKLAKAQRRIHADDEALSRSEFDAVEYASKDAELAELHKHVRHENMVTNVSITFAFADANHQNLGHKVDRVIDEMAADGGFQLFRHPGAQVDLWRSMLPCTSSPRVVEDSKLTTTVALLGATMPVRRQSLGDPHGWPIGECLENSLGQIVYLDCVTPTEGGDASIDLSGEPFSGKSNFAKFVSGAIHDVSGFVWFVDPTGEMEVFASEFPGHRVVNLANPEVSLDLLKCFPEDVAGLVWLDVWCPLLSVDRSSAEYERLTTVLTPAYRRVHRSPHKAVGGLSSTRDVLDHITTHGDEVAGKLRRRFAAVKDLPAAACLIDPVNPATGKTLSLPAFNSSGSRFVVFNTRQYQSGEGEQEDSATTLLSTAVFTAVAALAKYYFERNPSVNLFGIDEAHEHDAPIVRRILGQTTAGGRKFKNVVLVSKQRPTGLGDSLDMAAKRGAFRQTNQELAIQALQKAHIDPTPTAVNMMRTELSPAAPGAKVPDPGREGELFWWDGRRAGKMRTFLPFIPSRARLADTRPEHMTRVDDHRSRAEVGRNVD